MNTDRAERVGWPDGPNSLLERLFLQSVFIGIDPWFRSIRGVGCVEPCEIRGPNDRGDTGMQGFHFV